MSGTNIHVVKSNGGWAIKREHTDKPISSHDTKADAISRAEQICLDEECDLVIHRRDGTFQNVRSFADEEGTERDENGRAVATANRTRTATVMAPEDEDEELEPHDVFSVGTRIAWSAIAAGVILSVVVYSLIMTIGGAIALTFDGWFDNTTFAYAMSVLWMLTAVLGSLFVGGYATTRFVAGEDKFEAMGHGVVLWGSMIIVLPLLSLTFYNLAAGAANQTLAAANAAVETLPADEQRQVREVTAEAADEATPDNAAVTPQDMAQVAPAISDLGNRIAGNFTAGEATWWVLAAMILSLGAAVLGAVLGAGPELAFRRLFIS
jgi:uncharacterized integral membrane protein